MDSRRGERTCAGHTPPASDSTKEKGKEKAWNSKKYFGVRQYEHGACIVGLRVDYKGKGIGRFFHRIHLRDPMSTLIVAIFLVATISHYGGRKPSKEAKQFENMNLRCLLQEVFNSLPCFPKTLVSILDELIHDKKNKGSVPHEYRAFIIKTWNHHKDKALKSSGIRVSLSKTHVQQIEETPISPSLATHVETEPHEQTFAEDMEMEQGDSELYLPATQNELEIAQLKDTVQKLTIKLEGVTIESKKLRAELQAHHSLPLEETFTRRNLSNLVGGCLNVDTWIETCSRTGQFWVRNQAGTSIQSSTAASVDQLLRCLPHTYVCNHAQTPVPFMRHAAEAQQDAVDVNQDVHYGIFEVQNQTSACIKQNATIIDNQGPLSDIDKCLIPVPPITREEANNIPSKILCQFPCVEDNKLSDYDTPSVSMPETESSNEYLRDFGEGHNSISAVLQDFDDYWQLNSGKIKQIPTACSSLKPDED